jgi:hypothetical protein
MKIAMYQKLTLTRPRNRKIDTAFTLVFMRPSPLSGTETAPEIFRTTPGGRCTAYVIGRTTPPYPYGQG